MDICSTGPKCAAVLLFICGALQAVTIAPLPYRGNEPGYRLPRGIATFLDQEEANRICREMMAERGSAGFYGGRNYDRSGYGSIHNSDGSNGYFDNEIDRDVYYEKRSRDYYPNYNPDRGSSNRWDQEALLSAQDCYLRGEPYDNNGISSYNWARSGFINRRGNADNRNGVYNRNRGQGFKEHNSRYQPQYDTNRCGFVDVWSTRGYYGSTDKDDNVGEGTIGFYGKSRRQ